MPPTSTQSASSTADGKRADKCSTTLDFYLEAPLHQLEKLSLQGPQSAQRAGKNKKAKTKTAKEYLKDWDKTWDKAKNSGSN
ncbi:hypothetical protein B0H67DRAFT_644347 [Lasiosphaeris hirsuta]|uniref:Uncharacterized protein n=1 Tax=Lasiosphaeris hirsuta TaxID=260670 RepID=A0AA40DV14_9PEZI|nr:hypothetical protein B0H67DRAFT_644347 [Lasiosphaeris hirsuta]